MTKLFMGEPGGRGVIIKGSLVGLTSSLSIFSINKRAMILLFRQSLCLVLGTQGNERCREVNCSPIRTSRRAGLVFTSLCFHFIGQEVKET